MPLIHHVVTGQGQPPVVFVHGFGCALSDWAAQVAHLAPRHQTIAVDLRGHGACPGTPAEASIERYGADIAELLHTRVGTPAVLVGHSMGCRVVTEAALQAPALTAGVVLVDGSQFAPAMGAVLAETFARPDGYASMNRSLFAAMFTPRTDPQVAAAIADRAAALPRAIGERLLADMQRYDEHRLTASLGCLRAPVMAIQTTWTNEKRERAPLRAGQATPYLAMLGGAVPAARIEIIPETGHFPQIDEPVRTSALLDGFLATLTPK